VTFIVHLCDILLLLKTYMRHWCLIPVDLAIQEVEIGRIMVEGQPGKKVSETPLQQTSWVW
jgi:hypothetical protein